MFIRVYEALFLYEVFHMSEGFAYYANGLRDNARTYILKDFLLAQAIIVVISFPHLQVWVITGNTTY